MKDFRELAEEIAKLSPIRDRLVTIISEALSRQYERGWNEAVDACKKVAEKIKVHPLNGFGACEEIAESISKLRRE